MPSVAKKKSKPVVLYIEMPDDLKARLARLAKLHVRKLSGEAIVAITRYVEEEEEAAGLSGTPIDDDDD